MRAVDVAIIAATGCVAALWLFVVFSGRPQARVVCHDPERGHLSADMDPSNAVETPDGWVLYFPNDRIGPRVQVWAECEVRQ